MIIKPEDVIATFNSNCATWGVKEATMCELLHIPTNIRVTYLGHSQWRARTGAFEALIEELNNVPEQLELF